MSRAGAAATPLPCRGRLRRANRLGAPGPGSRPSLKLRYFRLETSDSEPAEPPTLTSAVPNWSSGDTIPFGARTLRVVDVRDDDSEQPPVLVVEDVAE
jgi:hypothetical protein